VDLRKRAWLWYDGNATFEITIKNVRKGSRRNIPKFYSLYEVKFRRY
jgi:hypothetical protein